jgi:hypothetical protein
MEGLLSFRRGFVRRSVLSLQLVRHQGSNTRLAFPARDIDFLGNGSWLRLLRNN